LLSQHFVLRETKNESLVRFSNQNSDTLNI